MRVKPSVLHGGVLLAGVVAISLCIQGAALAVNEGDVAPSDPALEGSIQTSEMQAMRMSERPPGTPNRSVWSLRPETARPEAGPDPLLPARDKPMSLLNGLFESSETSVFPHP